MISILLTSSSLSPNINNFTHFLQRLNFFFSEIYVLYTYIRGHPIVINEKYHLNYWNRLLIIFGFPYS